MNKTTIIFDGECSLCVAFKQITERGISDKDIDFIPVQNISSSEFVSLKQEDIANEIHILAKDKVMYKGVRGVFFILSLYQGLPGLIGKLLFKSPLHYLAQPIYALIAKYRYDIFPRNNDEFSTRA